jgi:hypothetical protein
MIDGRLAILGWVLCFLAGVWLATVNQSKVWKREAVFYGCGAWVVSDTATGATEFKWRNRE